MTNSQGNFLGDVGGSSTSWIRKILKAIQTLAVKDSGGRLRVSVDNVVGGTLVVTQPTATSLNVLATLAASQTLGDITNIGGMSAKVMQFNISRSNYAMNSRSRLSYT